MSGMPDKDPKKGPLPPEEKKRFSELAMFLARAVAQVQSFGVEHPLATAPIEQSFNILSRLIQEKGSIAFYVANNKLKYEEDILGEKNIVVEKLVEFFSLVKLVSIEFERDFNHEDYIGLLRALALRPKDIIATGGIEKSVEKNNVKHIKLNPIRYELIGMGEEVVTEEMKVESGEVKIAAEDLAELEKILSRDKFGVGGEETKDAAAIEDEKLLGLIDNSLKLGTDYNIFADKFIHDPVEEAHLITEAIHIANRSGSEKSKSILLDVNKKIERMRNDLDEALTANKEDAATEEMFKAADIISKDLSREVKMIQVKPQLTSAVDEMFFIINAMMDEVEARKLLSKLSAGKMTAKKKASFLKGVNSRQKSSEDFEFMIKKFLSLRGMSSEQVEQLFKEGAEIFEQLEKEKSAHIEEEMKSSLQGLSEKQLGVDEVMSKLSQFVEAQVKATTKKLKQDNEKFIKQIDLFSDIFKDTSEGVVVLDESGKVVFVNKTAQQITGFENNTKLGGDLLKILEDWQAQKSPEEFLSGQKINENIKEKAGSIVFHLKGIKKDEEGRVRAVILKA